MMTKAECNARADEASNKASSMYPTNPNREKLFNQAANYRRLANDGRA